MRAEQFMHHQRGLITRSQAIAEAGLTRRQIDGRLHRGEWLRVQPRVYRHAIASPSWKQELQALTLVGANVVASHRSAAALFEIGFETGPSAEVTMPHASGVRRLQNATVHRSTQWDARQETVRGGIRCTGIERTIMDTAGTMGVDATERLAEEAVRRRHTSFGRLARYLAWHGRQGRTGCGTLRTMLERRGPTAPLPLSDFSRRVTQLLACHGVLSPELEYRIADSEGRFIMQADLVWPKLRKIVELDGLAWHFGRDDVERDRRKARSRPGRRVAYQ
jgi:hypothetical protein